MTTEQNYPINGNVVYRWTAMLMIEGGTVAAAGDDWAQQS